LPAKPAWPCCAGGWAAARGLTTGLIRAQPLHQRVGQGGQQQPELVGDEARATRARAEQIELRFLDAVPGLAALAVSARLASANSTAACSRALRASPMT
jgi:hypothetical protein